MPTQAEMLKTQGWVTVSDAAKRIGRHVTTVYRLIETKQVQELRVGQSRYVRWVSLVQFLGPNAAKALGLVKSG